MCTNKGHEDSCKERVQELGVCGPFVFFPLRELSSRTFLLSFTMYSTSSSSIWLRQSQDSFLHEWVLWTNHLNEWFDVTCKERTITEKSPKMQHSAFINELTSQILDSFQTLSTYYSLLFLEFRWAKHPLSIDGSNLSASAHVALWHEVVHIAEAFGW